MKDQSYYDDIIAKKTKAARQAMKAYDFEANGIPAAFIKTDQMKKYPAPPFEKALLHQQILEKEIIGKTAGACSRRSGAAAARKNPAPAGL